MLEANTKCNVMQEFDMEFLLNAQEIYIFSACRHILEQLQAFRASGPAGDGEQVKQLLHQLRGLAQATERFDIVVPWTPEAGFSPFFWRWFNWWHDYRQSLTRRQLDRVHRLQDALDPSVLTYRPVGDWLKYKETPPPGLNVLTGSLNENRASSGRRAG